MAPPSPPGRPVDERRIERSLDREAVPPRRRTREGDGPDPLRGRPVVPADDHMRLLRSRVPHATIESIDVTAARAMSGVIGVLTGEAFPIPFGILPVSQDEHALARDKVRYVGD